MDNDSLYGDRTPTRENPNVFDDEFEAEDGEFMVADGFRPGVDNRDDEPVRTAAAHVAPSSVTAAGPSRNSTRKSRGQQNPFASPEDEEAEMPLMRTPSGNFDVARRSVSSASSHQFARTSSPRFGAGPSHPYGMYPQGTMARTPSVATTSTIRPQRQSSSRQPQHPYALYTQGVGDDFDSDVENAPNAVPVGFLGIGEHYQRRRGPDGEEQGLLGDFGHTEQLPPYSRYPEDGPEKMPLLDVPNPPGPLHSRAPVLGTDPGMELMHTQLATEPQSMTDQSELNRAPSIASRRSRVHSMHARSQDDSLDSNKTWSEKSWREKRRTRFCGVPCWWFIALTGALVFIAAMLGGVIGGFLQGQKQGQANALKQAAESSLYDVSIIATSTTAKLHATGVYALPLGPAQETQAGCLPDPNQQVAWNCDLAGDADIQIVIDTLPGSDQPGAYLTVDVEDDPIWAYGAQKSNMATTFSQFLLVIDNDEPSNGPAYYFQQQYNKLVLIPEHAMDMNAGKIKREAVLPPSFSRQLYAAPSDKPWLCYWNNTFIEGFIYPNKRANVAPTSTTSYPTPPPTPPPSTDSTDSYGDPYRGASHTTPWSITGVYPEETITTTVMMPTTSCTYTGAASAFPSWMHKNYPGWYEYDGKAYPSSWPTGQLEKRDGSPGRDDDDYPQYPFVVKIEERRQPGSSHAYCNQIVILDDWNWNFAVNNQTGETIAVSLTEQDASYHAYSSDKKFRLRRRKTVPGECHCQWQSGQ